MWRRWLKSQSSAFATCVGCCRSGDKVTVLWVCWGGAEVTLLLVGWYCHYVSPSTLYQSERLWLQGCFLTVTHLLLSGESFCLELLMIDEQGKQICAKSAFIYIYIYIYIFFKWSVTLIKFLDKHKLSQSNCHVSSPCVEQKPLLLGCRARQPSWWLWERWHSWDYADIFGRN